ncbi:DUF4230 domain-containing protein [Planococcus sp. CPCC 101016]|uniref:DUF4230 domain-containing protein n=1 Tax=Planococcus sp. CPCC 101016 TaxID=2599617 RepID=UPI0011B4DB8C|nr:DUF4230 domain-containing protein [Planococcus sp. CPCC 101016]TWT05432.1 DUF4230 domain-containing protein [Planococcus sp. CPCC 101016]
MKKLIVGMMVPVLLIGIIVLVVFIQFKPFGVTANQSSNTSIIQERVVELSELATLKYEYSKAMVNRDSKNIPLTDIRFAETIKLIEYTGYMKAGSDLSKVDVTYDEVSNQVTVRLPKAKILDNVVETENMKVEDVKGNIFPDPPTQQIIEDINIEKKKFEEEKISQGFLTEADKRTEEVLKSFLNSDEENEIIVEFY